MEAQGEERGIPCGGAMGMAPLAFDIWLVPLWGSRFVSERLRNPSGCPGNGGLDKDSDLYVSQALHVFPVVLFNLRVIEQGAGRAPTGTFWNTLAIVGTPTSFRLIVSSAVRIPESGQVRACNSRS